MDSMKRSSRMRAVGLALGVLVAAVALAGCSEKGKEPLRDAPRSANVNDAPADVIVQPDGFSNIAVKCDGPNRVYSAFHGDGAYASIFVVPNDPRCAK